MADDNGNDPLHNNVGNASLPDQPPEASGKTDRGNDSPAIEPAQPASPPPSTSTSALREDLLKPAVSFLSSPNVRSSDTAKKVAFLRQKGLTQPEIEEAFRRAGNNSTPNSQASTAAPPVPPRPATLYQQPQQIVYYSPPPPPMPAQRVLGMALLLGFGAVGLTAVILRIVKRLMGPLFESIAAYRRSRYNERRSLLEKLNNKLLPEEEEDKRLALKYENLSESLARLTEKIKRYGEQRQDQEPYADFRNKLADLRETVSQPDHIYSTYSSYMPPFQSSSHLENPAVKEFKSEIRSFKGMLLSRRNFPMVNTNRPASSTTTTTTTATRDVPY